MQTAARTYEPHSTFSRGPALAGLLWGAIPLALHLFLLRHLWFNAPIWDDYDAILDSVGRLLDAESLRQWWHVLVAQHNEHRIAVMRFSAWVLALVTGTIDFRVLVAIGNLSIVGIFVLAWAEFRHDVAAPLFAAAGFLLFQWSYYEATLMGSAALPNIGVVFFSFASLFFALRGGAAGAVACMIFAILATGSQANGLFALPMAAAACLLAGRRQRGLALAAVAGALWALFFIGYSRPAGHPSVLAALENPLGAAHLFTIVIGGLAPIGAALLALIGWLAWKRAWTRYPTAALWVAFVLLSAAAATAGRIGFGVFHASRYAVYSSSLAMIGLLAVCALTRPWSRRTMAVAIAAAALASGTITWISWPRAMEFARQAHLLARVVPAPEAEAERYVGMLYPSPQLAAKSLASAEKRGLYVPRERPLGTAALRSTDSVPRAIRVAGHLDRVEVKGARVLAGGWTDIPPMAPGRVFSVFPQAGRPLASSAFAVPRPDVARLMGRSLEFSGFRIEMEYPSEDQAASAASRLCLIVEAPGYPVTVLASGSVTCGP